MNEVAAAMGLTNLESLDKFVAVNRRNYECYNLCVENIPGIKILRYDGHEKQNYQYITIEVDEAKAGLSRDELLKVLHSENVLARRYFYPGCHRMEPYRSYFPHSHLLLPETEEVAQRVLVLPTGTAVTPDQISIICSIIRIAVENAPQVKEKIQSI
jgi:dTDP-4-amino-4,6-dideoxygalactose transaminase